MTLMVQGEVLVAGEASGTVLASDTPLSFWGGFDPATGEITDRRHPLSGEIASGRLLVLPFTKGSSTATAILLEAVRAGTQPAAILCRKKDPYLALASVVADEMYAKPIPLVQLSEAAFGQLQSGHFAQLFSDGQIALRRDTP